MKQKELFPKQRKFNFPRIVLVYQHGRRFILFRSINRKTLNSDDRNQFADQPFSFKKMVCCGSFSQAQKKLVLTNMAAMTSSENDLQATFEFTSAFISKRD